jgi:superkiller protein 3
MWLAALILNGFLEAQKPPVRSAQATLPRVCADAVRDSGELATLLWKERPIAANYNQLGLLFAANKNTECAVAAFDAAVRLDPEDWQARYNLGLALMRKGSLAGAVKALQTAMTIRPDSAETANNLAVAYARQNRPGEAANLFRKATELRRDYTDAYINWANVLISQGRLQEAIDKLAAAIRYPGEHARTYTLLATVKVRAGRLQEAVQAFRKAVELDPRSAQAHLNLGVALGDLLDFSGALQEFSKAVELAPGSSESHYYRGRALFDLKMFTEAQVELEAALRISGDSARALLPLAEIERKNGNVRRSMNLLRKVLASEPRNATAQYLLGRNLFDAGDPTSAVEHWKAAVEIDPEYKEALYSLVRALRQADPQEAARFKMSLVSLGERSRISEQVRALNNFALADATEGRWAEALQKFREAFALCGECPELAGVHRNLGLLYARRGDLDNAELQLRAALQVQPKDADAMQALEYVQAQRIRNPR